MTSPPPPYGYKYQADGVRLEEHTGEQKVIAAINEYRAEGLSSLEIEVKLAEHGFQSTGAIKC
jgi:hypothetical protein